MTHTDTPRRGALANAFRRLLKSRFTRRRRLILVGLALTFAAPFLAYRHPRAPFYGDGKAHVVIEETIICDVLPGYVDYSEVFSDDYTRCAYVVERSGQKAVVVDGVEGPLFDEAGIWDESSPSAIDPYYVEVECYRIQFSDDGAHVAYFARQDGKYCVVYDGLQGPFYEGAGMILGSWGDQYTIHHGHEIRFSEDSRHWAYSAIKSDKQLMVIDGQEGPQFDEVVARRYELWSPDGEHRAYTARLCDKWRAILDGRPSALYDEVDPYGFVWSDDSAHFAFCAGTGGKCCYVVDGVEGMWYDEVNDFHFSRSGGTAYVATENGQSFIVSNGIEGPRYDSVKLFEVDDAGGPALYWVQDGLRTFVMDHGTLRPGYDSISTVDVEGPTESYDTSIYAAHKGKNSCIVVDGIEGKCYDSVSSVYVSPDGKRLAYDVRKSESQIFVVDGVEYGACESTGSFEFSPDSRHFIYDTAHSDDSWADLAESLDDWFGIFIPTPSSLRWETVELDGNTIGSYKDVRGLSFTADGKHIFYAARLDGEDLIFIDGQKASEAIDVLPLYDLWSDGDSLMWVTMKNDGFKFVKATIVSD